MITFQYILLHILLFICFFYFSKKTYVSNEKYYWQYCLPCIIFFTIEEGFRWGRHIDWCLYYTYYELAAQGYSTNYEFIYKFLFESFSQIGIPYFIFIAVCSFIWVFSLCSFNKNFKNETSVFLVICLLWFTVLASNTARWFLGLSFALFAYSSLIQRKYKLFVVFILLTFGVHLMVGAITLCTCFIIYNTKDKLIFIPQVVIFISIFLILLFQVEYMSILVDFLNAIFSKSDRFSHYLQDADVWFLSFSDKAENSRKDVLTYLLLMIPFYIVIYFFYSFIIKNYEKRNYSWIYNMICIGVILRSISSGFELLQRIATYYDIFIVLGMSFLISQKKYFKNYKVCYYILLLFICYKGYVYIKPFESEKLMKYIWNDNLIDYKDAYEYLPR